ncbi:MAG: DUF2865 domain-containing protein [Pseudomonadota bacterium]
MRFAVREACRSAAVILSAAMLLGVGGGMFAVPAQAQGPGDFFAALFGGFIRPRPAVPLLALPAPEAERPVAARVAYCVRLCDGKYFPLSGAGDPQTQCAALCPKADTRVYRSVSAIDTAEHDGSPYTALPTAFRYRTTLDNACSCTGNGPLGLATPTVEQDASLKSGDVVMTADGPKVFQPKGGAMPHPPTAFVPPEDARRLSRDMRQRIEELRLADEAGAQAAGKMR